MVRARVELDEVKLSSNLGSVRQTRAEQPQATASCRLLFLFLRLLLPNSC